MSFARTGSYEQNKPAVWPGEPTMVGPLETAEHHLLLMFYSNGLAFIYSISACHAFLYQHAIIEKIANNLETHCHTIATPVSQCNSGRLC